MCRVFFVDTHTLDSVKQLLDSSGAGDVVIPLTPQDAYVCQRANVGYRTLESFIDRHKLVRSRPAITKSNNIWLSVIDEAFQRNVEEFHRTDFAPARLYTMALHGLLDEFYAAQEFWRSLRSELAVTSIYAPRVEVQSPATWGRVLPQQKILALLLPHFAHLDNLEFKHLETVDFSQNLNPATSSRSIVGFLYRALKERMPHSKRREIKLLMHHGALGYFYSRVRAAFSKRKRRILFVGGGYDLGETAVSLRLNGFPVDILEFPDEIVRDYREIHGLRERLNATIDELVTKAAFLRPFHDSPLTLDEKCISLIRRWAVDVVPRQWRVFHYCITSGVLSRYAAVVTWAFGEGEVSALVDAFRKARIPSFCFQHGGASRNAWLTDYYQEYLQCDTYLAYGPGQVDILSNLDSLFERAGNRHEVVPVGSVRLDNLYRSGHRHSRPRKTHRLLASKPQLLVIPTVFDHPGFAINDSALLGTEYFHFQQAMLLALSKFKNWHVMYKAFPGTLDICASNPIRSFIVDNEFDNITYVDDTPVTSLMWSVDKIIIDHNQTALNELLLTSKPILVFDQGELLPWTSEAVSRTLLRETVVLATTRAEFFAKLEDFVTGEIRPMIRREISQFTMRYGTHVGDGRSVERAVRAIAERVRMQ